MNVAIDFEAPPTVARFLESDAFCRLIVGPVGSGKSSGCNVELVRRAVQQHPGPDGIRRTRFAVIRNTYRELRDTTRKTFEQWLGPLIAARLGQWREADFAFRMQFSDVDCEVLFRALDRAEDVKKLLSLELTGAYINEAREVPAVILAGLKGRVGRYPSMAQGGPSWWGVWMDTNPMHVGHELYKLFVETKPEGHALFWQPDALGPEAENLRNLVPGYYRTLCQGQDEEWVDEYVRAKAPKRDRGSIFGDLLSDLEAAGAMREFECPLDGVFVTYDLGVSDATAQWYWRVNGPGVDVLDHYEANGKPISHFFDEAEKRAARHGFSYLKHWLPHDARARTLVTGASVLDSFLARYGADKVAMTPELSIEDGLQAARWLLEKPCRFHPRTSEGVQALRAYRYAWDSDRRVFSRKPVHDWASNSADSWRYVACAVRTAELLTRKPTPPAPPKFKSIHDFTMDEVWALRGPPSSRRRI